MRFAFTRVVCLLRGAGTRVTTNCGTRGRSRPGKRGMFRAMSLGLWWPPGGGAPMMSVPQTRVCDTPRPDPLREVGGLVAGVSELSAVFNVAELGPCHAVSVLSGVPSWSGMCAPFGPAPQ